MGPLYDHVSEPEARLCWMTQGKGGRTVTRKKVTQVLGLAFRLADLMMDLKGHSVVLAIPSLLGRFELGRGTSSFNYSEKGS